MEKIKINIASGSILDKPLITAFKNNNVPYVVMDNEINGTMGLPIILVSKLENNKLTKITDRSPEWESVKEALRHIISGMPVEYITVDNNLNADELFFSQLTLPVASFETLKNNYKPVGEKTAETVVSPSVDQGTVQMVEQPATVAPQMQTATTITPVTPFNAEQPTPQVTVEQTITTPTPQMPQEHIEQPVAQIEPTSAVNLNSDVVISNSSVEQPATVTPQMQAVTAATPVAPKNDIPVTQQPVSSAPQMPQSPIEQSVVQKEVPQAVAVEPIVQVEVSPVEPMPINNQVIANVDVAKTPTQQVPVDFTADKEAFLKACENMFDALVAKFKN